MPQPYHPYQSHQSFNSNVQTETCKEMARKKEKSPNVTLKDVAHSLGISTMTVSRAINNSPNVNEKTKATVLERAREMGFMGVAAGPKVRSSYKAGELFARAVAQGAETTP